MTQNQIAFHNAKETARHNLAMEVETRRHQQKQEELQSEANELQRYATAVNEMHYARLDAETQRSNRAREIENYRSDIAGETIKERANAINAAAVSETSRHNQVLESLQDVLNASMISKNEAEVSYISSNAGYIQAQTWNELAKQPGILYQNQLTEQQYLTEQERTKVEHSKLLVNAADVVDKGSRSAGNLLRSFVPVLGN